MNSRTVLIVDDEPHMQRLVAFALKPLHAQLLFADSGLEALRLMRDQSVHVAIFDVHMKDIDGLNALKEAKGDPSMQNIPIILLTGAGETHVEEEGRALGAEAFFRKPFSPSQLAAKVKELLTPPA